MKTVRKANGLHADNRVAKQLEPELEPALEGTPPVPANGVGLRRVGDVANEVVAEWGARRIDTLSARIAANQVERLRELSLVGYAPRWSVVETALRLEARRILEEVMES